jgi:hypothetical protein
MPAAVTPTVKEIPYDHVAKFTLKGKRAERVQEVINVSTDGAFVAVAIAYSFIPAPLPLLPTIDAATVSPTNPVRINLINFIAAKIGAELNKSNFYEAASPELERVLVPTLEPLLRCLLVRLCGIDFKYSIIDSGSGRELQNLAIHNIAGLGESSGDRPFRPLAKPMLYMPRSTIRIEVEEISEGPIYTGAELFIVLHGYKMLGYGTGLP